MVVWIIGLSGAGKTSLAKEVVIKAKIEKNNTVLVDGDVIREIFGNDLSYSMEDRLKNAERICQLCKFLDDQGINVVCAILSIFPETREWNRENINKYYEVFIDTPMTNLVSRDSKGIYEKYNRGEISEVAGMDINFPEPVNPDLVIHNYKSFDDLLSYAKPIVEIIIGVHD
jgi:adenylylsulfate kinase-like enzyme